jgi:hypothetical protein
MDRDGMYVLLKPSGTLTFRLDYRMNGRRETVTFGKYGPAGLSLARAHELCIDAKRAISEGRYRRAGRAGDGAPCPRYRQADLRLRDPARREGRQFR